MGEVINLSDYKKPLKLQKVHVGCLSCHNDWVEFAPHEINTDILLCPACGQRDVIPFPEETSGPVIL
jgi:Zn finger protein HypA/HybF involved in hydrogenase expression